MDSLNNKVVYGKRQKGRRRTGTWLQGDQKRGVTGREKKLETMDTIQKPDPAQDLNPEPLTAVMTSELCNHYTTGLRGT